MGAEKARIYHLYHRVLFPYCSITVNTNDAFTTDVKKGDRLLVMPVRSVFDSFFPRKKIATLAEVTDITESGETHTVLIRGLERIQIHKAERGTFGYYTVVGERDTGSNEQYVEALRKKSQELIFLINVEESDRLIHLLNYLSDLNQLADFVANYFVVQFRGRYRLLRETRLGVRYESLMDILDQLIAKMKKKIQEKNEKTGS